MKLLRYRKDAQVGYGILEGETVYQLIGSPYPGRHERGPVVGPPIP